ncbi:putative transcription factor MYB-related family [Helianthus annuus]|uniref:Transcription factor MYB-related family n=3 Tax=Helianthus annuus TaxID=4232 RepID=A0A9K3DG22_HELAN|nr:transcription factor SRM1 isoform X1 [Helianthus annuus]KAF5754295.1 putative transcription factor MYB-related family [Helianthus annuus]
MADEVVGDSKWTRGQDRAFEDALVAYYKEDSEDCWEKIATDVAGKSVEEVKHHYELLVDDLDRIESGIVPLPSYSTSSDDSASHGGDDGTSKKGGESVHGGKSSKADQERRKGVAWSEDEHRLFLLGLEKYGKGDWRSISRNFVVTRTPTQVASHAQKYFIRLNSMNRDRRRSSIHDITSVNNGDTSAPQAAITGQTSTSPAGNSGNQNLQVSFVGGTTVGQPVGLPLVSAVGTPVILPPPAHIAYGIRAPGQVVPGAPMNMGPTSSRR